MSENLSSLLIGVLFGASLDLAGFGSPRTLNSQFQLRDFSMFKVMFGAIVVAASVYLLMLGIGLAPVQRSVIPTLDLAVLLGGFLLGVGLVVGGYCPGTALTGAAGESIHPATGCTGQRRARTIATPHQAHAQQKTA